MTIHKHPWNTIPEHIGSIKEIMGYGCSSSFQDEKHIIFFDTKHSMCEMHQYNNEYENNNG